MQKIEKRIWTSAIALGLSTLGLAAQEMRTPNLENDGTLRPFSAEEGLSHIEVPEGFKIELVASEPMVQEPVSFVFDADGAMYVLEWLTYMQDQYATGQGEKVSRIVKLEDSDGDGKMDKRTVFADKLMLPRSIIALHDRVLVRMSHSSTIWAFYDDNNDGVADRREIELQGSKVGGNIEHQDNALVWNSDNRIYATGQIYSLKDSKLSEEKNHGRYGQWGLTRDNLGRIYGSSNSVTVKGWHSLGGYPIVDPSSAKETKHAHFTCDVDDATNTGTMVTSIGGQGMLRSPQFGQFEDMYIVPDPVRRMLKLVEFKDNNGDRVASVPAGYEATEFIRSADTYFRPVWCDLGPDGGLYIADMSRGIIQESQWFPTERTKNPNKDWLERYYRTKDWGMLDVVRRGRIYRLVPEDISTLDSKPQLSKLSSSDLVKHLAHPNGWWRDTAHKLIVSRGDDSVVPALKKALESDNEWARMLSLRSLDAYNALSDDSLLQSLGDPSENVRVHAIAIAESRISKNPELQKAVLKLQDDSSATVINQLYASLSASTDRTMHQQRKAMLAQHSDNPGLKRIEKNRNQVPYHARHFTKGHKIYMSLCADCHGDGTEGLLHGDKLMAPVFAKNKRIKSKEYLASVIMKGIYGPLGEGEVYSEGVMPPMEALYNDEQLTDLLNFIGMRWRHWKEPMTKEETSAIRASLTERKMPWTFSEIQKHLATPSQ